MPFLNQLPVISLRKEPSEKSELVSQLLYGETFELMDHFLSWALIRCTHDGYEGWISHAQLQDTIELHASQEEVWFVAKHFLPLRQSGGHMLMLPFGSTLANRDKDMMAAIFAQWQADGSIVAPKQAGPVQIVEYARLLLGCPYLWGGRNPLGYDCSGFVQVVYKVAGHAIPRDAGEQAKSGQLIDFLDFAKQGDLAFFENEAGNIVHVGILDGNGGIIHCSGKVRMDIIDAHGIFQKESRKHTHKLRFVKRVLPD
ncbi:MAG TPA: C40 family peptidase [Bacteroidales bacterium]|nr:C40 family peptidase [Bacteroidales bacterium]